MQFLDEMNEKNLNFSSRKRILKDNGHIFIVMI